MEELLDKFIGVRLQLRITKPKTYKKYYHKTYTFTVLFARRSTKFEKLVLFLDKYDLKFIIYPINPFYKNFIRDILSLVNENKLVIRDRKISSLIASNKFGKGGRLLYWDINSKDFNG